MQRRTVVVLVVAAACVLVIRSRGSTAPAAEATPAAKPAARDGHVLVEAMRAARPRVPEIHIEVADRDDPDAEEGDAADSVERSRERRQRMLADFAAFHHGRSMFGQAVDVSTQEPIAGVTVTVTSPALEGAQTAITDEDGFYAIVDLPPGEYKTTMYYLDNVSEVDAVTVTDALAARVDQSFVNSNYIYNGPARVIDPTSTSTGITIDPDYTRNIPVPGRTFESVLGAASGSQGDSIGVSFSGGTSLENTYYVDGDEVLDEESGDVDVGGM